MKLIYLTLVLLTACGKKNFHPPHRLIFQEESSLLGQHGISEVARPESGTEATLLFAGGGESRLDWQLKSSARSHLLRRISEGDLRAESIPERIEFFADFSATKDFWQLFLNGAQFEKLLIDGLRPAPVASGEIQRGRVVLFGNGGDQASARELEESYRVVLSQSSGERIFYVHHTVSLQNFLQALELEQNLRSGWHFVNLPQGLRSAVDAGQSYALVEATAGELEAWKNETVSRPVDLRAGAQLTTGGNSMGGRLTLHFPHSELLQIQEKQGNNGYRQIFGNSYSCDYKVFTSLGYAAAPFERTTDSLSYLQTGGHPLTEAHPGRVAWEVIGALGIAIQIDVTAQQENLLITASPKAQEKLMIGAYGGGGCRPPAGLPEVTHEFARKNLKAAMFWHSN